MRVAFYQENGDFVECAVYSGDVLDRFYRFPSDVYTGSIAVGKVKFVKKDVGIFVDIGLDRDGLMSYRPGVKSGDTVLVRVETEPKEDRGCSLSEKISIAGRFAVLLDREEYVFSKEISQEKKAELFTLPKREGVGFIYRSLAKDGTLEEIAAETEELHARYLDVVKRAQTTSKPTFLYRERATDLAEKTAKESRRGFTPQVKKDIAELLCRKVTREGVELVFDRTEAMTVVDVNFHRSAERGENAVYQANYVAVIEFARQVRLRNIGGIILLDYISMPQKDERDKLYDLLKEELKKDFVRCESEHAEKTGLFIIVRPRKHSAF